MAGSKRITGQEALDEHRQRHGPAAGNPAAAARHPTPALHLEAGIGAGEQLHPVAVLGIGGLLRAGQGLCLVLGAQKSGEEAGGVSGFALGRRKAPGGADGIAVVVEVEVAERLIRKT